MKNKTKKKQKISTFTLGFDPSLENEQPAVAMIVFAGNTLAAAQDKVFDYVDQRRPIIMQLDIRDYARQKGYTWMSGEYCPTGGYLMRFRGYDLKTFSVVGRHAQEAEAAARMVLKCLPDKAAA